MRGPEPKRPTRAEIAALERGSTASISTILSRAGVRRVWMPLKPLFPGTKIVGPALTIRTVPGREDLQPGRFEPHTEFPGHPDDAIEAIQPGDIVVLDGRGATDEGLFGDLLTLRTKMKGAAGLVSDMAVRDSPHLAEKQLPIYCRGTASPGGTVFNVDFNVPIGCAGVLVCPGDILVGDDDGVVVIPLALVEKVVQELAIHEEREEYIRGLLAQGVPLDGVYPTREEIEQQFQAWRKSRDSRGAATNVP